MVAAILKLMLIILLLFPIALSSMIYPSIYVLVFCMFVNFLQVESQRTCSFASGFPSSTCCFDYFSVVEHSSVLLIAT